MRENIKISRTDKKRNKLLKKSQIFTKKMQLFISFGQMCQNEST